MGKLKELADSLLAGEQVSLLDAGAAGGANPRWEDLRGSLRVIGFEPDPEERQRLADGPHRRWIGKALAGSTGTRELKVTRSPTNTSLLEPNRELLDGLDWSGTPGPDRDHEVIKRIEVPCTTVDDALRGEPAADYLKVDTQGTELEILQGGVESLRDKIVLVEVETEFVPVYEGQPLFADVDAYLRGLDFELLDLGNLVYVKPKAARLLGGPKGRLISADALYIKSTATLAGAPPRKIAALVIGLTAYGLPDLASQMAHEIGNDLPLTADELDAQLSRFRHPSRLLPPTTLLANAAEKLARHGRPVKHALWMNPLGNRLI